MPDFSDSARVPVKHPLEIAAATLVAPLGPDAGRDAYSALFALSFLLLLYAVFRLGRALWTPAIGLLAAGLLLTFPKLVLYAAICLREVPFAALVVLALALAIENSERNWPKAMGLLALAGLLRPEAWALSAVYGAWLLYRRPGRGTGIGARPAAIVLVAIAAPLAWALFDLLLTGDPFDTIRSAGPDDPRVVAAEGFHPPHHRPADIGAGSHLYLRQLRIGIPGMIGWPLVILGSAAAVWALVRRAEHRQHADASRSEPVLAVTVALLALLAFYGGLAVLGLPAAPRFLLAAAILLVALATTLLALRRNRFVAVALLAGAVAILVALPGNLDQTVDYVDGVRDRGDHQARLAALAQQPAVRAAVERCPRLAFGARFFSYASIGRTIVAPRVHVDVGSIPLRRRPSLHRGDSLFLWGIRPPPEATFERRRGEWTFVSRCGASGARSES